MYAFKRIRKLSQFVLYKHQKVIFGSLDVSEDWTDDVMYCFIILYGCVLFSAEHYQHGWFLHTTVFSRGQNLFSLFD